MTLRDWITASAVGMFLLEGFFLSVFPQQVREFFLQADVRTIKFAGLLETVLAIVMLVGLIRW